MAILISLTGR